VRVGAGAELLERDDIERAFVRGLQHHGRGDACRERFFPAQRAEAPVVAGLEAWETELRARGDQVVAAAPGEFEELGGHAGADDVQAAVVLVGVAAAVAEEPCERIEGAGLEVGADANRMWCRLIG